MHGVKRTKPTEPLAARRAREVPRIAEYQAIVDDLLARNRDEVYDQQSLDLTSRALKLNPELYTAWNLRRRSLLALFQTMSLEEQLAHLISDINLTSLVLKSLPKVYWIWNHRLWCLSNIPYGPSAAANAGDAAGGERAQEDGAQPPLTPDERVLDSTWKREAWERELLLVDKMLSVDPRNFHAWNYRRQALTSLATLSTDAPESVAVAQRKQELAFTQKKIESNFSNFSAWHQRMRVLGTGPFDSAAEADAEFELVNQALWTDPNDQSSWLYHRFLVTKTGDDPSVIQRETQLLRELHELEPDAKWPMDTLVHYHSLLIRRRSAQGGADERERLRGEVKSWLERLEEVDPARQERYRYLARKVDED